MTLTVLTHLLQVKQQSTSMLKLCQTKIKLSHCILSSSLLHAENIKQVSRFSTVVKMTEMKWKIEKKRILRLPMDDKRKLYKSEYISINAVDSWDRYVVKNKDEVDKKQHIGDDVSEFQKLKLNVEKNKELAQRVSIYKGDITQLEVDAIVNAANSRLIAGGGVDGAIHRAAGPLLQQECNTLGGCPTGDAKVSGGYNLPAKYVIHTVGPQDGSATRLQSCYEKCLSYQKEYGLTSIAFPCISTGVYGFPNRIASHIALSVVRKFLEDNDHLERVVFCTFMKVDIDIYETLMQLYFPVHEWNL